jgi:hypothetical protein
MYWVYASGVHEIVILAAGDLALIIAACISLFGLSSVTQFFQHNKISYIF